ncbi:SUKH-3 domain-containing protein [Streptomyces sp. NPDC048442]|uniref:SUKH-3 domain-containing protein n=1 Tax=Streptomyces sp. NPDC048442 TaxID=3154823 RepID=UPI0034479511
MLEFPLETNRVLREAGWEPGRRVDPERWLVAFEEEELRGHAAARDFLAEFGGLAVGHHGHGVSRTREPFAFDPLLCLGEGDRFAEWGALIGRVIFPVGEHDGGRFFLGIDETGELYLVETRLASFGVMPEAMNRLVLGVQPKVVDGRFR